MTPPATSAAGDRPPGEPLMIRFACPQCWSVYEVPDAAAGKKTNCRKCGQRLMVPAVSTSSDGTPETAPQAAPGSAPILVPAPPPVGVPPSPPAPPLRIPRAAWLALAALALTTSVFAAAWAVMRTGRGKAAERSEEAPPPQKEGADT